MAFAKVEKFDDLINTVTLLQNGFRDFLPLRKGGNTIASTCKVAVKMDETVDTVTLLQEGFREARSLGKNGNTIASTFKVVEKTEETVNTIQLLQDKFKELLTQGTTRSLSTNVNRGTKIPIEDLINYQMLLHPTVKVPALSGNQLLGVKVNSSVDICNEPILMYRVDKVTPAALSSNIAIGVKVKCDISLGEVPIKAGISSAQVISTFRKTCFMIQKLFLQIKKRFRYDR